MDMRELAKSRLREYAPKVAARENIADEIRELEYRRRSLAGAVPSGAPGKSAAGGREDLVVACIQKQAELEENLYLIQRWLKRVERGLEALVPEERRILDGLYIHPERGAAERLAENLEVDVKTVYYRGSLALRRFATAMFGGVEL